MYLSTSPEELRLLYKDRSASEIAFLNSLIPIYLDPSVKVTGPASARPAVQHPLPRLLRSPSPRRTAATGTENRWSMILIPEHWLLILLLL